MSRYVPIYYFGNIVSIVKNKEATKVASSIKLNILSDDNFILIF